MPDELPGCSTPRSYYSLVDGGSVERENRTQQGRVKDGGRRRLLLGCDGPSDRGERAQGEFEVLDRGVTLAGDIARFNTNDLLILPDKYGQSFWCIGILALEPSLE